MQNLYWMDVNDKGLDHYGTLMTKDQLVKVFSNDNPAVTAADIDSRFEPLNMILDVLVLEKLRGFEGEFTSNVTYQVVEIPAESYQELIVRDLMTWYGYDPEEGFTAVELNSDYPDYVPYGLRLQKCVYGLPGHTIKTLPFSREANPTVDEYEKILKLTDDDLKCEYTRVQKAAFLISQALQEGRLTEDLMKEIAFSNSLVLAMDIDWDYGEDDDPSELPKCAVVPDYVLKETDDLEETVSDWLSDTYEFCHKGFVLTKVPKKPMTLDRAKELLNKMIEHESVGRNCQETLKHLLWLGFTGEELWRDFGFNLHDVADAEEDMNGYEED